MRIFTRDEVLIAGGVRYLQVVGLSYLMTGISQIFLCILKNSGQAMKSTVISSFSVVLNIFLNAVFIFGFWIFPEMGIAGAALATVIAKAAELLWLFAESCREGRIHLRMRYVIHTDPLLRKDFWKYTTPVLANEMVWGCGFTMYSVIMGHLGSDAVAANSIANIVKNLIACFCSGIGNGGGILVGNELGQGNLEKARRLRRPALPDLHCKRHYFRIGTSGVVSADPFRIQPQRCFCRLSEGDASDLFLLYDRKGGKRHHHRRNLLRRRRLTFRSAVRYDCNVGDCGAPGAYLCLCA
ncbi:MAG: MATE family efflux transporter [Lachnospiraceae bacterium]